MAFRYDYFPYNDTIAAEVYNNLYVRIFEVECFPLSGQTLILRRELGSATP